MNTQDQVSRSGLFELFMGWIVEGDCVTRTSIQWQLVRTFDTSEALQAYWSGHLEPQAEYLVRYPKAFLERHQKLAKIRQARRDAEALLDPIPF